MGLNITKTKKLPENVYDVVIDPGHGGSDSGAINGRYQEADIVLDYAKDLKSKLEDLGLKVLLTRDGSEADDEDTVYNIYDEDGRVTMANKSGAKIILSLINSDEDLENILENQSSYVEAISTSIDEFYKITKK